MWLRPDTGETASAIYPIVVRDDDPATRATIRNALGKGWFVDPRPLSDASFALGVSATRLYTYSSSAPAGHIDLLTAIEHEMGHRLGLDDKYSDGDHDDIMYGYLTVGERRLPSAAQPPGEPAPRLPSGVPASDRHGPPPAKQ